MPLMRLHSVEMSRRDDSLEGGAFAAVGAASADSALAAKPKKSHANVEYQDTPHGIERCEICAPFLPLISAGQPSDRSAGKVGVRSTRVPDALTRPRQERNPMDAAIMPLIRRELAVGSGLSGGGLPSKREAGGDLYSWFR
jgi:hypothetical protein